MISKLIDFVRLGRWLLCGLCVCALRCKRLLTDGHKEKPSAPQIPGREHVVARNESRLLLLSTQPMILSPSYSELVAPVRDLPPAELKDAIQNLHLVKIGSPQVFPVEIYLRQLESTHNISECVQTGTSSIQLALELSGHTGDDEVANNFILHFSRKHLAADASCKSCKS